MNDISPDTLDTPPQSTRRRRWLQGTAATLAGVALGPLAGLPARAQAGGHGCASASRNTATSSF